MFDETRPPRRIAITGIAGYVGRGIAAQLDVDEGTDHVLGIDIAPYRPRPRRSPSCRRRSRSLSATCSSSTGSTPRSTSRSASTRSGIAPGRSGSNIQGTKNFLDACARAKVKMVLVASSATAYGAHPTTRASSTREAPLRAKPDFPYAHDKVRVEELCYEFARANPDASLAIVRPA